MDERIFIAKKVASELFAVESAIEAALASTAMFAATLPEARVKAKLSATVGQGVFDSLVAAIASLNDARRHIVETHKGLDSTKDQLGMRTVAFGSLSKPMAVHSPAAVRNAA